jgi:hypothetical protein
MKRIVPLIIAMVFGWLTLITYFWPLVAPARYVLVELAVIVAAFAAILGAFNVIHVHGTHIFRRRRDWFFSFILLASLGIVLVIGTWEGFTAMVLGQDAARQGVSGGGMVWIYQYILIPVQASLSALLPFLLAFAAYRTLRMRSAAGALGGTLFLITAIVVLLGQVPLFNLTPLRDVREWIVRVPAMAGMRGIALGVGLGITATALRVLIGADRPSSD